MKTKAQDNDAGDKFTPRQVSAALVSIKTEKWQALFEDGDLRKTCAFQTREGGSGILQITGD